MKKILFTLMALVASMSLNAQVMKIMKNGQVVKTYTAEEADEVIFEEAQAPATTGTAKATINNIDADWVQLWEGGPKFATRNVGSALGGGYPSSYFYTWGGWYDCEGEPFDTRYYYNGSGDLSGNSDTATNLWGSNWRMPTASEFEGLLNPENCTKTNIDQYPETGEYGVLFTGKGAYANNSIFLTCVRSLNRDGEATDLVSGGFYWTSTRDTNSSMNAYYLYINGRDYPTPTSVLLAPLSEGFKVRPVLNEP